MATILERWAKRRHLKEKMSTQKKKMWDLEFYIAQLDGEREGFRLEYDRIKESLDAADLRLKTEKAKEDPDKTICENLENLIKRYTPDMEQLKGHMSAIDLQIEGYDAEEEGQKIHKAGVKELIQQHRSLLDLLTEYRKKS